MILNLLDFNQLILQYLLPLFRILAMIMAMPIFGTRLLPNKIKLGLGLALTICVAPLVEVQINFELFSILGFIVVVNQVIIGVVFGLIVHIIFQAFMITGQIIAMQMGLGFAQMVDPQNGVSVPALGQVYLMLVTLLFLSINGHLTMINIVVQSFKTIPIGFDTLYFQEIDKLAPWGAWMFSSALKMAIPAISALFLVNIAFGVMTKAAPQLNIFTIGFPATMVIGIIILWFVLGTVLPNFTEINNKTISQIQTMAKLGALNG